MKLQYVIENTVYETDVSTTPVDKINSIIWNILHELEGKSIKLYRENKKE